MTAGTAGGRGLRPVRLLLGLVLVLGALVAVPGAATAAEPVVRGSVTFSDGSPVLDGAVTVSFRVIRPDGSLGGGTSVGLPAGGQLELALPAAAYRVEWSAAGRATAVVSRVDVYADVALAPIVLRPVVLQNRVAPSIGGDPRAGGRLVVSPGAWSHAGVRFAYQWYVGDVPVRGATRRSFLAPLDAAGRTVSALVTARLDDHEPVEVWATERWVLARPTVTWADGPRVVGTVRVGATLRGVPGLVTPSPTPPVLAWSVDGHTVKGATGPTFVPRPQDLGKRVVFSVSARVPGYEPERRTTFGARQEVARGVISVRSRPSLRGTARVGRTLKARAGSYAVSGAKVTYQWLADGRTIAGATRSSLRLGAAHRGARIAVRVTVEARGYATRSVATRSTGRVRR